jgi:ABC-2 type transport system ATP-binding protein
VQVELGASGDARAAHPLAAVRPLTVDGLELRYGPVHAVRGLSFGVSRGAVVGLIGPNGCGKTSTLRAIVGLLRPAGGRVLVSGSPPHTIAARRHVAYVPDEPDGLDELCVGEYIRLVRVLYRAGSGFDRVATALLRAFGLDTRTRIRLEALSHGQRRATAIVAAIALARPLLVVDEATAALDPEASLALRESLRAAAASGSGVLVATQELTFAERVCDEIVLLSGGRIVAAGPLRTLTRSRTLEELFLEAVGAHGRLAHIRNGLDAL